MMATAQIDTDGEQHCSICLGHFNQPRLLPCAHTFCQSCLQSYITTEATKYKKLRYIHCPVCRTIVSPKKRDKPTSEWASLFSANTVLQSMLPTKSKVDRLCDACNAEGATVQAEGFCALCKEAMCADCMKFHRKQTVSKNHTIVKIQDLTGNIENVMKCAEGFTCSEHDREDIKFYCREHKFACCAICYFHSHKTCPKVIDLNDELHTILHEIIPEEIGGELKNIETHLKKFMEINESSINDLKSQVNGLQKNIRDMRKKINTVLDNLEKTVKTEGSRIYKEEVVRKQETNNRCLALVHAVRNSHFLFETVHKYGSDIQKFLMTEKIKSQLLPYYSQIRENYETTNTVKVELEFSPLVESMLSLSLSEVGKILYKTKSALLPITLRKQIKDCQVEKVHVIDVELPGINEQCFTGVTFLPNDKVMLANCSNQQCILLSPSYEFIASYKLTGSPVDICVVDDHQVALTIPNQNKIQIMSVRNDIIRPVRLITSVHSCYGIAGGMKGEMFVTGNCGNNIYQLSRITKGGEVKSCFQYDAPSGHWNYVALDSARTRVYITVPIKNSLLCFNMDGTKQFTYSPVSLIYPFGIGVDRDDNACVLGYNSNNIHQLSPDGSVLQLITTGVPNKPRALCFNRQGDVFLVTSDSDKKLYTYELK